MSKDTILYKKDGGMVLNVKKSPNDPQDKVASSCLD